jgi:hypothetical protein
MYEIQLRKTANGTSPSSTIREQSLVSEARDDFFIGSSRFLVGGFEHFS